MLKQSEVAVARKGEECAHRGIEEPPGESAAGGSANIEADDHVPHKQPPVHYPILRPVRSHAITFLLIHLFSCFFCFCLHSSICIVSSLAQKPTRMFGQTLDEHCCSIQSDLVFSGVQRGRCTSLSPFPYQCNKFCLCSCSLTSAA